MISIILPTYNEEKNIGPLIKEISSFFKKNNWQYEIIVVNDGSKDRTEEILRDYENRGEIKTIKHQKNLGYGAALRSGFSEARGDLIFFTDSDRQFNINDITPFMEKIKDYDYVIGFRKKRSDPFLRILYAEIFRIIAKTFFRVKVRDVDCAFKLFKRKVLSNLNLESNGALINLEILALARKKNYKFAELAVSHFPRKEGIQTGGSFKVISKALFNIFKLWIKINRQTLRNFFSGNNYKILVFSLISIVATFLIAYFGFIIQENHFPSLNIWNRWDTPHYLYLAEHGYCNFNCLVNEERFSIAFFPLYPFLINLFSFFFLKNYLLSALFISNICFVLLLYFFYKLVKKDFSEKIAFRSIIFLSIFPTAYFFHAGYTESLFLLLAVSCFYFARSQKWRFVSLLGGLASLTRFNGIILFPAIFIEYLISKKFKIKKDVFYLLSIPLGFLTYLYLNYKFFGNFFQFVIFQKEHWHRSFALPIKGLSAAIKSISWRQPKDWLMVGLAETIFALFAFFIILFFIKKIRISYSVYAIINLILITFYSFWLSIPRYVIIIFPIFIILAILSQRLWIYYSYVFISLAFYVLFLVQFVSGNWSF